MRKQFFTGEERVLEEGEFIKLRHPSNLNLSAYYNTSASNMKTLRYCKEDAQVPLLRLTLLLYSLKFYVGYHMHCISFKVKRTFSNKFSIILEHFNGHYAT